MNGRAANSGPGAFRRSDGSRSRSARTREPSPASGLSHASAWPICLRTAQSIRDMREVPREGSAAAS